MELSEKAGALGRPRASADHDYSEGDYRTEELEETVTPSPSILGPRELKERQRYVCPSCLSVGGTRRSALVGKKRRTNGRNMGEPIRTRKGKLAAKDKHNARMIQTEWFKSTKERRKSAHLSSAGQKFSLTMVKRNRKRSG